MHRHKHTIIQHAQTYHHTLWVYVSLHALSLQSFQSGSVVDAVQQLWSSLQVVGQVKSLNWEDTQNKVTLLWQPMSAMLIKILRHDIYLLLVNPQKMCACCFVFHQHPKDGAHPLTSLFSESKQNKETSDSHCICCFSSQQGLRWRPSGPLKKWSLSYRVCTKYTFCMNSRILTLGNISFNITV